MAIASHAVAMVTSTKNQNQIFVCVVITSAGTIKPLSGENYMDAFSFSRDFKKVRWGSTLWLNLLRAFFAGIVWAIVMLISSFNKPSNPQLPTWYTLPLFLPLMYIFGLPLFLMVAKILSKIVGDKIGENLGKLLFSLGIVAGDPFVFILHKIKPEFVPVEKFNFMNFNPFIFVLDPAKS